MALRFGEASEREVDGRLGTPSRPAREDRTTAAARLSIGRDRRKAVWTNVRGFGRRCLHSLYRELTSVTHHPLVNVRVVCEA